VRKFSRSPDLPICREFEFANPTGNRGLELLRDAVDQLERSPARLLLAEALVAYGAALRRGGNRALAREPLRRGLDIASASGARPLTERARQELNATGLRVRRDAQTGVAALTPSERRVADHAATGATNPQIAQALFVTVKTVEMHLGNAYRKLDITTRSQLPEKLRTGE
jgi:DNA-binding CsgD family transcriptional regulator